MLKTTVELLWCIVSDLGSRFYQVDTKLFPFYFMWEGFFYSQQFLILEMHLVKASLMRGNVFHKKNCDGGMYVQLPLFYFEETILQLIDTGIERFRKI